MTRQKKLAQEFAESIGYHPGSCSAQGSVGYSIATESFENGYMLGVADAIRTLSKALDKEDFSSVQPATKAILFAKLAALSMKEEEQEDED